MNTKNYKGTTYRTHNTQTNRHRRSIRLKDYDYSKKGSYFVTICVKERKCLLGDVVNGEIVLSAIGKIVRQCWVDIPNHFPHTQLDEYAIMPNHVHGIIAIACDVGAENIQPLPKINRYQRVIPGSLGVIMRGFKTGVTKYCNQRNHTAFAWQRNYYEHIIRNEDELNRIREYITNNPLQWQFDRENPMRVQDKTYEKLWGPIEEVIYGEKGGIKEAL